MTFPTEAQLAQAAAAIRRGDLVAFPTETVYGLGANAFDEIAVRKIFAAKERPFASPLIVHVASVKEARALVTEWPDAAARLAEKFWPGPLTMVLPKAAGISDLITAGLKTVGVRIPVHPVALQLIQRAGVPIAAPSANRFTQVSPTTAQHVEGVFGDAVAVVLDGGPSEVGIESTVVDLHRSPPLILRPGMIPQTSLEEAAGVSFQQQSNQPELVDRIGDDVSRHRSPGQHPRHYSPQTPLVVLKAGEAPPPGDGVLLDMPSSPEAFAARLYAELHAADRQGANWIALQEPPADAAWDGIRDRLRRASRRP